MTVKKVKTKKDLLSILPLLYELQMQHVNFMPSLFRDFESYENLISFLENENDGFDKIEQGIETILIFEDDYNIAGTAYLESKKIRDAFALEDKDYLFIHCFIMDEKYRDKGYGRQCFELVLKWAEDNSFDRIELQVYNKKAVFLYEKFGFKKEMVYMGLDRNKP